jgi:hypothetical protein
MADDLMDRVIITAKEDEGTRRLCNELPGYCIVYLVVAFHAI